MIFFHIQDTVGYFWEFSVIIKNIFFPILQVHFYRLNFLRRGFFFSKNHFSYLKLVKMTRCHIIQNHGNEIKQETKSSGGN